METDMFKNQIVPLTVAGVILVLAIACAKAIKDPFIGIQPAVHDRYGYTMEDPIRIKYYKYPQQNITLCKYYIFCLQTENGERLEIASRVSVEDPIGGILDEYTLVTEQSMDTLKLYFDIYRKRPLQVPRWLRFVEPEDDSLLSPKTADLTPVKYNLKSGQTDDS